MLSTSNSISDFQTEQTKDWLNAGLEPAPRSSTGVGTYLRPSYTTDSGNLSWETQPLPRLKID